VVKAEDSSLRGPGFKPPLWRLGKHVSLPKFSFAGVQGCAPKEESNHFSFKIT
jgi:hypothetical protein